MMAMAIAMANANSNSKATNGKLLIQKPLFELGQNKIRCRQYKTKEYIEKRMQKLHSDMSPFLIPDLVNIVVEYDLIQISKVPDFLLENHDSILFAVQVPPKFATGSGFLF